MGIIGRSQDGAGLVKNNKTLSKFVTKALNLHSHGDASIAPQNPLNSRHQIQVPATFVLLKQGTMQP